MSVKWMLVIFTCLTLSGAQIHNVTLHNMTHVTHGSFYDSAVLKLRNQLLYVSYPKVNADVRIKLESLAISDGGNGTCEIVIPVPRNRDLLSPRAKLLGNEKLVVAIIETRQLENAEDDSRPYVRFYVLDPLGNCSLSGNFSILFDDAILWSYEPFGIIPYQDSFDVFAKSYLHCEPPGSICMIRYNDKGDSLGTRNFNFPTRDNNFDLVKIHPVREFDATDGYVFVSKHSSNVTTLDSNLKVLKQIQLHGYITAHSVLNGDVGVCYHADDVEPHSQCLKLDSRLKTVANVSLSNSHYFVGKRLYNLADGSSLFASVSRGKVRTLVRRLSVDGRISLPEIFRYECDTFVTDTQDRFVELKGGIYCFSFICKFSMTTHCVKSTDAKKLLTYLN